jgi:hypothetical protein
MSAGGKGDARRPQTQELTDEEVQARWDAIFPRKKPEPQDDAEQHDQ